MQIDTDRFIIMITCKPVLALTEIVSLSWYYFSMSYY